MKLFFFALVLLFCCDISYGVVFDPYSRRYNIRNASFDALFSPSPTASTAIQAIVLASTKIDNDRCKAIHQYAVRPTLDQLVNFQYELIDLCPQLYETIRSKNITTWGPIDEFLQIWYMKFVDALWKRISLKQASGRCALYDDFLAAAENDLDTALMEYLENNYNPSLCEVNDQTMREWHLFFQRTQVFNRITKHLKIGSFSISLVHAIAKAYLTEARYNSYLTGPPFPLITYMNASLTMPALNFTLTQKSFIKQTYTILNTNFGTLDLAGRQNYFLMKFSESIDTSWALWQMFTSIPLDPLDAITYYHLLLYYSRKEFLLSKQLQYVAPPITTTTTSPAPPLTCPTVPTVTTTAAPCIAPPGTAALYLENGVVIDAAYDIKENEPVGTCISGNGVVAYCNGSTPQHYNERDYTFLGVWLRSTCSSPCICTATACYVPKPENPSEDLILSLYPHCTTPDNCYVVVIIGSPGAIVNPLNSSDYFSWDNQYGYDVTDPSYPKVTKIGCNGCSVIAPPPTIPACVTPPGTAAIYYENGVVVDEVPEYSDVFQWIKPSGTCNSGNGKFAYYNGSTPLEICDDSGTTCQMIGTWLRSTCSSPCICTSTACYTPQPGHPSLDPEIFLFPHCTTPNNCFIVVIFDSTGSIVNPLNATDYFSADHQFADSLEVTRPSYPRVTKIGCNGCPVIETPSTCSCPSTPPPVTTTTTTIAPTTTPLSCPRPSGTAEIFIENGVTLADVTDVRKAKPTGTCVHENGITAYYNGSTPQNFQYVSDRIWVGDWLRAKSYDSDEVICSSPCICTATACYVPETPSGVKPFFPRASLYPHCITPNNCFVAAQLRVGNLVNPLNATDIFMGFDSKPYNSSTFDSTGPNWAKITKVGCNGCPVVATPSTCTCPPPPTPVPTCVAGIAPPSGTAEIFIGNDVILEYDGWSLADPVSTCMNPPNGYTAYYNGSTPEDIEATVFLETIWVGTWYLETCLSPCLCTAIACYTPVPDSEILFYPHCKTPNNCFVVPVIWTGSIVNPLNSTDVFDHQDIPDLVVTQPYFPKITKIGCAGCPVVV